ncbi:MAG: hypothetical protein F4W93_13045 [Dehalococcoidia bacterium]|nr:hypothetical protein [Dehalococcoidia bacterium]
MPLAAALLLMISFRGTAQAQGTLQGDVRHVVTEIARRLGTSIISPWRWRQGVQSNLHHLLALQYLADSMKLVHLLPGVRVRN